LEHAVKYEIDLNDHEVHEHVRDLRNGLGGDLAQRIANEIEGQIKLTIPTGLGAVVRTSEGLFVLADGVDARHWYLSGGVPEDWRSAGELGHVVEVLSEGVDA